MPSLVDQRAALVRDAKSIAERAKTAGRNLTAAEMTTIRGKMDGVTDLNTKIGEADQGKALFDSVMGLGPDGQHDIPGGPTPILTAGNSKLRLGFGEKFADHLAAKVWDPAAKAVLPSSSTLVPSQFISTIYADPQRPLSLLDVLPVVPREAPTFTYLRGAGRTGGAAPVAPGGVKPSLDPQLESVTGALSVIAVLLGWVDRFWLMDLPTVKQWIADEITYSIRNGIENQVINGDGTAPNLRGYLNTSGIQTQAWDTNALVTLRRAGAKLQNRGYRASAYVLNPDDWADVELTRQINSGSPDFSATPINLAEQRVWSTPVVTTTSLAAGTGLLLGDGSSQLDIGREGLLVDWSESAAYDATTSGFERNLLKFRGEQRAHLSVFRPDAVVRIDLVNPGP